MKNTDCYLLAVTITRKRCFSAISVNNRAWKMQIFHVSPKNLYMWLSTQTTLSPESNDELGRMDGIRFFSLSLFFCSLSLVIPFCFKAYHKCAYLE